MECEKMRKGLIKKIKLVGITMLACITLTGCGGIGDVLSGAGTTVNNRLQINKNLLQILKDSGLLTDAMYESLMGNLAEKSKLLLKISESDIDKNLRKINQSFGYAYYYNEHYSTMASSDFSTKAEQEADNWIPSWADAAPTLKEYCDAGSKRDPFQWPWNNERAIGDYLGANGHDMSEGGRENAVPYELFNIKDQTDTNSGLGELNTIINTEVYVLNYEALKGTDISEIAISCKTIKDLSAKESKGELTDDEKEALSAARSNLTVFKPSGMTLMDGIDEDLIRDTKNNDAAEDVARLTGGEERSDNELFNEWAMECKESDVNPVWNNGSDLKESLKNMEYDLALFSDSCPVITLRLRELNPNVVLALQEKCLGMGDAYLIDYVNGDPTQGKRIYKMVYPAYYVDSIKWDGSKTSFTAKESEYMNINIMTGEVALKEESTLLSVEEKQKLEKIYNVTGNSDNQSSFTIWDVVDTKEILDNNKEVEYKQNSILLKDYLEYTYLPDFIPGEPFVALGRRIRLYNFEKDGTFKDPNEIARFIDKAGHPIDGVKPISTDDLLDIKSGNSDNERKGIKSTKSMASGGSLGGGNSGGGSGGSGGSSPSSPGSSGGSSGGGTGGSGGSSGGTPVAGISGNSDPNSMGAENPSSAPYLDGSWEKDSNGAWQFKQLDGTFICNTWAWIDGNSDETAECYYFNDEGIMEYACEIDGHEVNDNGAMLDDNGDVVTKAVGGRTPDNEGTGTTVASISLHNIPLVTSNGQPSPNDADYISGTWEEDTATGTWKFKQDNGDYATDKWAWIDADGDGKAFCYRFEDNGILFVNGTVDSCNVDDTGAWYVGTDVQIKDVSGMTPTDGSPVGNNGGVVRPNTGQGDTGFASDESNHIFDEFEYIDELHPIATFPVDDDTNDFRVASTDAMFNGREKSRTIMYGLCTDVNMFDSQLYSAWINIDGDGGTAGSLNWWNTWLEQAKFDYRIDKEALMEYLGMNFTADLLGEDDSIIVLDPDTLGKIQKDMNEQDKVTRVTFIRTMFVIVGYLTMVYAFLFLAAWFVDVSTIGETKFMTIMTAGRCVAIRDDIERPYYDDSGTAYLTFGNVLTRCIIMLALSLILTRMDFIGILVKSFGKLGGVASEIFKRIFNI